MEVTEVIEKLAVENEFKAAKERFGPLINWVNEQYESPESTLESPEQIKSFEAHNDEILSFAIEHGQKRGLSEKEIRMLEVAAILHDSQKARKNPGGLGAHPYVLVAHGAMAADGVDENGWAVRAGEKGEGGVDDVFDRHPEMLKQILGAEYSEDDAREAKERIKTAIRAHMGPRPGFMQNIEDFVNSRLDELGLGEHKVEHPFPEDELSSVLLAADMGSLCTESGRQKVLDIRASDQRFQKEDRKTVAEYEALGVTLSAGEAALLSGHKSATEAASMLPDDSSRTWAHGLIEKSKKASYTYSDEPVDYKAALAKQGQYELKTKARDIIGALGIDLSMGLTAEITEKINKELEKEGVGKTLDELFPMRSLEQMVPNKDTS